MMVIVVEVDVVDVGTSEEVPAVVVEMRDVDCTEVVDSPLLSSVVEAHVLLKVGNVTVGVRVEGKVSLSVRVVVVVVVVGVVGAVDVGDAAAEVDAVSVTGSSSVVGRGSLLDS